MNNWENFRDSIKKVTSTRKHKVTKSLGVYDSYKYIRKHKWFNIGRPLKEHEFYSIIRRINNYLAEELCRSNDILLPKRMGRLEVRKKPATVKVVDNKVITNRPINWDATLKLWCEDKEAFEDRTLVKEESKEIFKVYYNKSMADYNNKSFYDFSLNRDIKLSLKRRIKNNEIDAFELYGNN